LPSLENSIKIITMKRVNDVNVYKLTVLFM
jgi:hypothetical protein